MVPATSPGYRERAPVERGSDQSFLGVSALLLVASTAVTILCGTSMAATADTICGAISMWIPMPGQTWLGAAAFFLGMWIVMMVAMMLPSLLPMLWRYRRALGETPRLGRFTAIAGAGYFCVWTLIGLVVFPLGAALVGAGMQAPALARVLPLAAGLVVLVAGTLQFTAWKAHHLACCRAEPARLSADAATAWRYGLDLGRECARACANLMAILLVVGVMDLVVMAAVTVAITAERVLPAGERVARVTGVVTIAAGLVLIVRATV